MLQHPLGNPETKILLQDLRKAWDIRDGFTANALQYLAAVHKERVKQIRAMPLTQEDPNATLAQSSQTRRERQLDVLHRNFLEPITWRVPELPVEHEDKCPYGVTYMHRLLAWVNTLRWGPYNKACEGITWFELYVNFRVVTQSEMPINVSKDSNRPEYYMPQQNPDVLLLTVSERGMGRMWLESLRTLALLVNQPLFPCAESNWVRALQKILPIDHGSGLAQRPQLLRPTQTYVTVQNAILSTCRPGRFGGVGVPDIPILQPEVLIEMPKEEKPNLTAGLRLRAWKKGHKPHPPLARDGTFAQTT